MRGMKPKTLVRRIILEMEHRMLTQAEVARMAKINRQRLNTLIHGKHCSLKTIRIIWKALGLGERTDAKS